MKYMLVWMTLHGKDGFDAVDDASLLWQCAKALHPQAEPAWEDFTFLNQGKGVDPAVMSAPLGRGLMTTTRATCIVAGAVSASMPTSMTTSMPTSMSTPVPTIISSMAPTVSVTMPSKLCNSFCLCGNVNVHKVSHVMSMHVEQLCDLDLPLDCRQHLCELVDFPDAVLACNRLLSVYEVNFVQQDLVCEGNLLKGLIHFAFLHFVIQPCR
mmetsp:Transcript_22970/g.42244  ORF Transcript_22970/g.42244 Transcript_22970/m.42244 type:complete len:211 (-) Transcript_22970:801-1433(-)